MVSANAAAVMRLQECDKKSVRDESSQYEGVTREIFDGFRRRTGKYVEKRVLPIEREWDVQYVE